MKGINCIHRERESLASQGAGQNALQKKGATPVSDLKKTLVRSFLDKRDIFALRQSNQTLLVSFSRKIADSDKAMLTDKYGNRYSRDTSLEQFSSHMVFTII